MSIRTVEGVLNRVQQLAASDPSPDARAAYRVVLAMFSRVDTCDMDAAQAAFVAPPEIGGACRCGLCDSNPDAAFDADFPAELA